MCMKDVTFEEKNREVGVNPSTPPWICFHVFDVWTTCEISSVTDFSSP